MISIVSAENPFTCNLPLIQDKWLFLASCVAGASAVAWMALVTDSALVEGQLVVVPILLKAWDTTTVLAIAVLPELPWLCCVRPFLPL